MVTPVFASKGVSGIDSLTFLNSTRSTLIPVIKPETQIASALDVYSEEPYDGVNEKAFSYSKFFNVESTFDPEIKSSYVCLVKQTYQIIIFFFCILFFYMRVLKKNE